MSYETWMQYVKFDVSPREPDFLKKMNALSAQLPDPDVINVLKNIIPDDYSKNIKIEDLGKGKYQLKSYAKIAPKDFYCPVPGQENAIMPHLTLLSVEESNMNKIVCLTKGVSGGTGYGLAEIGAIQMSTADPVAGRYQEILLTSEGAIKAGWEHLTAFARMNGLSNDYKNKYSNQMDKRWLPGLAICWYANSNDGVLRRYIDAALTCGPDSEVEVGRVFFASLGSMAGRTRIIKYMTKGYIPALNGRCFYTDAHVFSGGVDMVTPSNPAGTMNTNNSSSQPKASPTSDRLKRPNSDTPVMDEELLLASDMKQQCLLSEETEI